MEDTRMQVASIMSTKESEITFKIHKVQYQKGSDDCGLFAIAYATDLAYGNDPVSCRYKQKELRAHFLDCLKKKEIVPFPRDVICPTIKSKCEHVSVHCSCRLPDNGEEKMAQCGKCSIWYHQSCEEISDTVFELSTKSWLCSKCYNC